MAYVEFRRSDGNRTGYIGDGGSGNNVEVAADSGNITLHAGSGYCQLVLNGSSLSCSSDRRLKKNIEPLENSLINIAALQGVSYRWQKPGADANRHLGLIAQDVEAVFPDLVLTDAETGMKSIEYTGLIAPLIEAMKELKAENAALRAEFEAFKKAQQ